MACARSTAAIAAVVVLALAASAVARPVQQGKFPRSPASSLSPISPSPNTRWPSRKSTRTKKAARSGVVSVQATFDCDPIDPAACILPFPNSFWLRPDPTTYSGSRVHFGPTTLQTTLPYKDHINPSDWNKLDGFPIIPAMTTYLADAVLDATVPRTWNESVSLSPDCPTVIINADTLEHLPHFVELDMSTDLTSRRLLMIWPLKALDFNTRYIVAVRNIRNTTMQLVAPSFGFQALRDNISTDNYDIEGRRDLFKDIFARLASANVPQSNLQIAWDFTTSSKESVTGDLVFMRDDATARIPANGPTYTITNITDNFSADMYRRILGTMNVPLYMTAPTPGTYIVRDENGTPLYQKLTPVPFEVLIPRSLVTNGTTGPILQYGHGLFGDMSEIEQGYLQDEANEHGYVMAATNWWGLCDEDEPYVIAMIAGNMSDFRFVPDRLKQGMTNALMLMKVMKGAFASDPAVTFNGKSVIDPTRRFYNGNSEGGIFGHVYMAASQDVERGVLGVMGGPYGLLLPRSVDFSKLFDIVKARILDSIDRIMLLSVLQMQWDGAEPAGYLDSIVNNPLPNTKPKVVIQQYGLGDAQVNYLGAYTAGRSVGSKMFINNVRENNETLFGFEYITGPTTESIIQGYDFGVPVVPMQNTPPSAATDTHELPRRDPRAQAQMAEFFATGTIVDHCNNVGCQPLKPTYDFGV
ncbi:hypothetical protein CAOG_03865 [Capsaspora owczarzaki ATCC 30864]|uniref:Uncharacterized protein n=1 Tax=Capsaspora owczarzaki (strain ATCC 30864) TaxID=595528 RepID=A0A0D2WNZ7_CAPO3|nr:hypothetical protein CAOG_03865 [Capsaspora owczarzaki ATCC 30864]KJE93000.1 hypothetical protein CAOG_003865 [Capsaspora owczarzaki ATCC 30864]|eukprot:XP_004363593.1 hypothetical protein CAOG_03865 [Capsaspora owczarzaki ATCC 30864]